MIKDKRINRLMIDMRAESGQKADEVSTYREFVPSSFHVFAKVSVVSTLCSFEFYPERFRGFR